jgi:UDP-N-acetyl-2-amino-2-deoxyglucuronate dehydrogenase
MRVGIIGCGAVAWKHAQAYRNIGFQVTACTDRSADRGLKFAEANSAKFLTTPERLCRHPEIDYLDVCTAPA